MPWEKGFAGVVLTGKSGVLPLECLQESGRSAKVMELEVEVEAQQKEEVKVKPSHTTKDSMRLPWARAQAEERDKVLAGWMVVIAEAGRHSKGREMIENSGEEVLDDIFARKKNGTLQVRLSAMLLYVRWARAKGLRPFPLDEDVCYNYVDQLRRDGAPATRASSFRSALAFCKACGRPISGVMFKLTEEVHALGSSARCARDMPGKVPEVDRLRSEKVE